MAYTVGSASVDIVPDFKNAQLAITAFFNKQRDGLTIPVKLDIDKQIDSGDLERQAANVGSRVSKAMSDGAAKNQAAADRLALQMAQGAERSKLQAHAEALRMNAAMDREAAKATKALIDEETKARVESERLAEQMSEGRSRAVLQAHAEALRLNAQIDRENARREAQQRRADETAVAQAMRTAQRIAEAERKARDQSAADRARQREIDLRLEEKAFQSKIKAEIRAMNMAMKEASSEEKIRLQVEIDQKKALLAGREAGGLVTRAMRQELHQNAGLIAAVIGGILVAGAPAAIGGAVALFGGIGLVAAAQSERVRSTYVGLWADIKSGAQADAASLVPVFERSAGQIGQAFEKMRPLVQRAFEASGPHIESFTSSILKASSNALPGLVHAVENAGPVVTGLGNLLEKTGSGVGSFFETLSTHSFAAGQAASALGDSIEALLPVLAELLGQGAETAAIVLPAITAGFRGLHAVTQVLGPVLPQILTGFLAFRAAEGVGRFIGNLGIKFQEAADKGGMFSAAQGRTATALSRIASATPVVGAAVAVVGVIMARSSEQASDWANALLEGGHAAEVARQQMGDWGSAFNEANSGLGGFVAGLVGFNATAYNTANAIDQGNDKFREMLAAMSPLERAQHDLNTATKALADAQGDESVSAGELARLKGDVARAAARQAQEEENLERATKGVTEAMAAQADAARARVDSAFGYQKALIDTQEALLDVTQAQTELDEARADGDPQAIARAELSLKEALLGVNDALSNQVKLAGDAAMAKLPASLDDTQRKALGAKAELDELNRVIAEGTVLSPEMEAYRQTLIGITGGAEGATLAQAQLVTALSEVGAAVEGIPDSADVKITAPTEDVKQRLLDLGFTITAVPGSKDVIVSAETDEAKANLGNLSTLLTGVGDMRPTPVVDADINPFLGQTQTTFGLLDVLDGTTATPTGNLNPAPFNAAYSATMAGISNLNVQRPTPTANMNSNPFTQQYLDAMGRTATLGAQRPTPVISAIDYATSTINYIRSALASIQDKTVSVTVRAVNVQNAKAAIEHAGGATGGSVADILAGNTPRFALGGPTTGAIRYGSGGPWDDEVNIRVSPGEHVLDYGDVVAMGGQQAVYDFRKMLHDGYFTKQGPDNAIRQMVTTGAAPRKADAPVQSSSPRPVALYTPDIPAAIRELKALEHEEAALAPVW